MRRPLAPAAFAALLLLGLAARASAQVEPVGVRAAGMGGAFTAVADDATAAYWNPAGLASGTFVGVALDGNAFDRGAAPFVGLATPPLGVSYFRTIASTAEPGSGRNAPVMDVLVHHAGATLVQSIGDTGLAVGATVGLVHGHGANRFGADLGAMLSGGLGRLGVAVHNVTAPTLGGLRLDRQVRAGASLRLHDAVTVAADADLTTIPSPVGRWRDAAVGVEAQPHARAWIRGGVHWNTAGSAAAPIGSAGGSIAVYGRVRADVQASFGSRRGDRGWGMGLSFIY